MPKKDQLLDGLERAVVSGKKEDAIRIAGEAMSAGLQPLDAIDHGLIRGMTLVGERYAAHKIFLPQVMLAAEAMNGALDIILPRMPAENAAKKGEIIIGVVEGDVHDIGKNIVKTMLGAAGFTVHDLGRDVSVERFVAGARNANVRILAMSTLMTPTMNTMKAVIDVLAEEGLRSRLKVIVGGAPTSQEFAEGIGADMHAVNAQSAVAKVKVALGD